METMAEALSSENTWNPQNTSVLSSALGNPDENHRDEDLSDFRSVIGKNRNLASELGNLGIAAFHKGGIRETLEHAYGAGRSPLFRFTFSPYAWGLNRDDDHCTRVE